MNDKDEKALIALLADMLHADEQKELTRVEIEKILAESEPVTEAERSVFEAIDPLDLIRGQKSKPKIIKFPVQCDEDDLPMAAGFYRGGEKKGEDEITRDSINKKREEILKRLQKEREEKEGDCNHD